MGKLFKNNNGLNYCLLEGNVGEPALLASLNIADEYILTLHLNEDSWNGGRYIYNLNKAVDEFNKIKKDSNRCNG